MEPKSGEKYKHFKGMEVEIICIARDCEDTEKKFVVYKHHEDVKELSGETIWIRELNDFLGEKEFDEDKEYNGIKFNKGDKVKRFTKI